MNIKEHPGKLRALIARLNKAKVLSDEDQQVLAQAWQHGDRIAKQDTEAGFSVSTLVSNRDGTGRIDVCWLGALGQMSVEEARSTAWVLVEAASVAETEAMLMRYLKADIGLDEDKAAHMLNEFRKYRDKDPQSLVGTGDEAKH